MHAQNTDTFIHLPTKPEKRPLTEVLDVLLSNQEAVPEFLEPLLDHLERSQ